MMRIPMFYFQDRPHEESTRAGAPGWIRRIFHRLGRQAVIWALLPCLCAAPAYAQRPPANPSGRSDALPALGDAGDMTPLEERRLGDLVGRDLYSDPAYMDDPIIGEYVDGIWRRLLAGAQARGELTPELAARYAWRHVLMRDREINAFAMPGGYMGLNLGLIGAVESRDELAAVLAHEMSHIMQRHIARMIATQGREMPLLLAAMVAGMLAGARNPQVGSAVLAGGQAAMAARQLGFSRDMERESDRIGYSVFAQAGFQPWGFVSMFEKLQDAARLTDNGDWPFLRTHPLTTERIADAQERQRSLEGRPKPVPDQEALLMAARARVLAQPGVDVLRQWARIPETPEFGRQPPEKRAAALYAAALAQAASRDFPKAQSLAGQLAGLMGGDARAARQVRLLQAELALQAGQPARALQLLPAGSDVRADASAEIGRAHV
jgi:predicted Zn-dependent protease